MQDRAIEVVFGFVFGTCGLGLVTLTRMLWNMRGSRHKEQVDSIVTSHRLEHLQLQMSDIYRRMDVTERETAGRVELLQGAMLRPGVVDRIVEAHTEALMNQVDQQMMEAAESRPMTTIPGPLVQALARNEIARNESGVVPFDVRSGARHEMGVAVDVGHLRGCMCDDCRSRRRGNALAPESSPGLTAVVRARIEAVCAEQNWSLDRIQAVTTELQAEQRNLRITVDYTVVDSERPLCVRATVSRFDMATDVPLESAGLVDAEPDLIRRLREIEIWLKISMQRYEATKDVEFVEMLPSPQRDLNRITVRFVGKMKGRDCHSVHQLMFPWSGPLIPIEEPNKQEEAPLRVVRFVRRDS